ncbi:MAG: recombinase family protein, partial [Vicinamibacterales bacterium]
MGLRAFALQKFFRECPPSTRGYRPEASGFSAAPIAPTPAGKLQLHILAALAEFERERFRERVMAGLQRARAQGKQLGRPRKHIPAMQIPGGSVRAAGKLWGVSKSTAARR